MYIENIKIGNFGKLSCKEIELSSGVNIIEGRNEAGKTTLGEFIKFVFYGLSNKSIDGEMSERKRHISWSTNNASGSIVLNTEKGKFRIERSIVPHGAGYKDTVTVVDLSNNSVVEGIKNPGEYFFSIPEEVFTRTVYIRQADGAYFNGDTIGQAVENIFYSADESVNTDKALKKLDDARVSIKHKKNTGRGLIDQLEKEKDELTIRLEDARNANELILQTENSLRVTTQSLEKNKSECEKMSKQLRVSDIMQLLSKFDEKKKYATNIEKCGTVKNTIIEQMTVNGFFPDDSYKKTLENAKNELNYLRKDVEKYSEYEDYTTSSDYSKDIAERIRKYGSLADIKKLISAKKQSAKRNLAFSLITFALALICVLGGFILPVIFIGSGLFAVIGIVFAIISINAKSGLKKLFAEFSARNEDSLFEIVSKTEEYQRDEIRNQELRNYKEQNRQNALRKLEEYIGNTLTVLSQWGRTVDKKDYNNVIACIDKVISDIGEIIVSLEKCDSDIEKNQAVYNLLDMQTKAYDENSLREELSAIDEKVDLDKVDEIKKRLEFADKAKESLSEKITELEKTLAALKAKTDRPSDIESRLNIVKKRIAELNFKHDAYVLAYEKLEQAGGALRSKLAPGLSKSAGRFMATLTDGKYSEIGVSDSLKMTYSFEENGTDFTKEIENLSSGTRDIAYISLRLSLAELFCKTGERLPVIFDEAFARVDDRRLLNMLKIAGEYADNNSQSIILTSHSREGNIIKNIDKDIKFSCSEL